MKLHQYTVTQLRLGASCPRVHYFDADWTRRHGTARRRVSLLWRGGAAPAGGALFHRAVERFTRLGTADPVRQAIDRATSPQALHRTLAQLFLTTSYPGRELARKPLEVQRGFVDALHCYLEELAHVAFAGRATGVSADDVVAQLFGDPRRKVDVTFDLGDDVRVRVTGVVDYVFYDWRSERHRIFDYKLSRDLHGRSARGGEPTEAERGDLVQVATYALMHDRQHGTRPDVAVYYLHGAARRIVERRWEQVDAERGAIYDQLASMVAWEAFDEATGAGLRPPGEPSLCAGCAWRRVCVSRLGPVDQGERLTGWAERVRRGEPDPTVEVHDPPEVAPEPELVDDGTEEVAPAVVAPAPAASPDAPAGLWVGADRDGAPLVVPAGLLNTHVAVVGAAGSGKTWTAKVIAEEAVRNGIPVIAIDPQGDLVQFLRRRDASQIPPELLGAYRQFADVVEPRIYTPGTSHAQRLCLDPIRLPKAEDLAGIEDPSRRAEEEEALLQTTATSLVSLANVSGDRAAQETFLLQILRKLKRGVPIELADLNHRVRDPELVGIDDPDATIKPTTRKNLGYGLNALVQGPAAGLFSGGTPLDLDAMLRPSAPGKVPLVVIYLNALPSDAQKQFFVAMLAQEIYRWMITRATGSGDRTSFLFYLDEAKDYLPAGTKATMAKEPLLRLFAQGRKYGVGCLVCTQSPRSVDYNAFGNCSTKVIGRLESQQDVERVREWFETSGGAPGWLSGRKGAPKGSFVARWAGDDRRPAPFQGRTLFSAHEGAWTPDQVERAVRADQGAIGPGSR